MQRESLGSRLGFILISAGCAIGIGNVWKFPYLCGQSGGGIFVLIYLFFLIILGLPAMTMEFAMGRASRKSPVKMYQELEPKGSKWHLHGYLCYLQCHDPESCIPGSANQRGCKLLRRSHYGKPQNCAGCHAGCAD